MNDNERNLMISDQDDATLNRIMDMDMIGLVRASLRGQDVTVIAEFSVSDDGEHVETARPLAILVNEALAADLTLAEPEDDHPADCDGTVTVPDAGFGGQDITGTCQHPSHAAPAGLPDGGFYG